MSSLEEKKDNIDPDVIVSVRMPSSLKARLQSLAAKEKMHVSGYIVAKMRADVYGDAVPDSRGAEAKSLATLAAGLHAMHKRLDAMESKVAASNEDVKVGLEAMRRLLASALQAA